MLLPLNNNNSNNNKTVALAFDYLVPNFVGVVVE